MGRKANPKCLYCARKYSTEESAKAKHPDCYVEEKRVCYTKRYRIRNNSKINAQRRHNYASEQNVGEINPLLPNAFWVELIIYGVTDQTVHAIALKIYQGNELRYKMLPQHTCGISYIDLKDYINKIMEYLRDQYGIEKIGRYYWITPQDCPVCRDARLPSDGRIRSEI